MCLKYVVGYPTCDHHEYLGSHHCSSTTPCNLDEQHFHCIEDSFPIPWPSSVREKYQTATACNTCAKQLCEQLSPDEQPVQYYAPTNDFQVDETWPTGYNLPVSVVRRAAQDASTRDGENDSSDDHYNCDYKSLSAADEDPWGTTGPRQGAETLAVWDDSAMLAHRDFVEDQLKDLPGYLAQHRQSTLFASPVHWPEAYGTEAWQHYPMPHMAHPLPVPAFPTPFWHGGVPSFLPVSAGASPRPEDCSPLLMPSSPAPRDAATPEVLPQRPATPASPPPVHPLPPRPTPPFIVGSITDAYLRIVAAKRRRMRERNRRARPSWPDALPTRNMALTDFVVSRKNQKAQHKDVGVSGEVDVDAWSSLPFAGEGQDAEGGAEQYSGVFKIGKTTCRFSCRLVTLM